MARQIVIAVDGSENSDYAVDWSLDNFFKADDNITVLYVFPEYVELTESEDGLTVALEGVSDKTRQALERANDMLLAIKEKIAGKVAQVDIVVESGDARGFIPLYCDKLRADALIIGSRGLGGLKRVLMGSVSDHAVHNVKCPVVIVRPKP